MPNIARGIYLTLVVAFGGCASIGPASVPRDRVDYVEAIGDSWKQQTLLNIVRMHYGYAPNFIEISSIISSYALQGQISAGTSISSDLTPQNPTNLTTVGAGATYLDRPTITYTPLTGDRFAKSLLEPVPVHAILQLIQSGYPADYILQMTAHAINGIRNRSSIQGNVRQADPDFYPLLDTLRRLQHAGSISLRLESKDKDDNIGSLVFSRTDAPGANDDVQVLQKTLRVKGNEVPIVFGARPRGENQIAILSRSLVEILLEIASGVQVPNDDVLSGETVPSARVPEAPNPHDRPPVNVLSGASLPAKPFVAVRYIGRWYWISRDDFQSKRAFTFLMMFLSLVETTATPQGPVVTLPSELIPSASGGFRQGGPPMH